MKRRLLVVIIFALIFLPCQAGAQTFAEAQLLARLKTYTQAQKRLGNADYCKPVLGQALFEGKTTGIKDVSASIRQESARIAAEFAGAGVDGTLFTAGQAEKDIFTREELFLAAYELRFRYATDKIKVVTDFLSLCSDPTQRALLFADRVPLSALQYLISEAEDAGMYTVIPYLDTLKANVFVDDPALSSYLDSAKAHIGLRSANLGDKLYNAILANRVKLELWMARALLKANIFSTQGYANEILNKLYRENNFDMAVQLKDKMESAGVMRADNLNSSFEYTYAPTMLPTYWTVTKNASNTVKQTSAAEAAASYDKGMEINNSVNADTGLANDAIIFSGRLPTELEFGVSYKLGIPSGAAVEVNSNGTVTYVTRDSYGNVVASAPEKLQLKINLYLTYYNGANFVYQIVENNPYSFGTWNNLSGVYKCPDPANPIKAAKLEIVASGLARILYLDDAFLRKTDLAFNAAPLTVTIIPPENSTVFAGEWFTLSADALTVPSGTAVTGQWSSSIEGNLGSPVSGIGGGRLNASVQLLKEGEQILFFDLSDVYGGQSTEYITIKVIKPVFSIAADATTPLTDATGALIPLSGALKINFSVSGASGLARKFNINSKLLVDGKEAASSALFPYQYTIDATKLSNGKHTIQASAQIIKLISGAPITPVMFSNLLVVSAYNPAAADLIAVITADPKSGNSPLKVQFKGEYSTGAIIAYYWNFGDGASSTEKNPAHAFTNTTAVPKSYSVKLQVKDTSGQMQSAAQVINVAAGSPPAS